MAQFFRFKEHRDPRELKREELEGIQSGIGSVTYLELQRTEIHWSELKHKWAYPEGEGAPLELKGQSKER